MLRGETIDISSPFFWFTPWSANEQQLHIGFFEQCRSRSLAKGYAESRHCFSLVHDSVHDCSHDRYLTFPLIAAFFFVHGRRHPLGHLPTSRLLTARKRTRRHTPHVVVYQCENRSAEGECASERSSGRPAIMNQLQQDRAVTALEFFRSLPTILLAQKIYPFVVPVFYSVEALIRAVDDHVRGMTKDFRPLPPWQHRMDKWDVSRITDFSRVFDAERNRLMANFNEDLSQWNVSNGTNFERMFWGCLAFNSDLSWWNVSRATNLKQMFQHCFEFKSDLSGWDVSSSTNFNCMFSMCRRFHADLSRWDVSNATNFNGMFYMCRRFNADLSRWDVSNANDLGSMFYECKSFNSDLSRWVVSNTTDFSQMFYLCASFRADLSQWDVSNAIELSSMFYGCRNFRSDLSEWNVVNARLVSRMFRGCQSFHRRCVAGWPISPQLMQDLFWERY
jgi:surface protein